MNHPTPMPSQHQLKAELEAMVVGNLLPPSADGEPRIGVHAFRCRPCFGPTGWGCDRLAKLRALRCHVCPP